MDQGNQQTAVFVDEATQKALNKPLQLTSLLDSQERMFLETVVSLVNEGKIALLQPSSLLNNAVYDKLTAEKQGKIDLEALNLLAVIREIKDLYDGGYIETYQMNNLVERLKATKERIEIEGGDVFII